ncbi:(Fe-S)-binding protein [Marinoscillum sp. MHG1-6]|uniref:(Fe-S)-binding protein n=1 Tax=Marinoscillum sp. MHG1-6 TaxID=2959627 RepID=UPI002158911F|nr:(Fe-S)-binding protein [Marinoscillum sp. MHG1-6]
MTKVALFIPCYVDQFYPQVGIATLELLEKLGCEVEYPMNQTCCGQPTANSGYAHQNKEIDDLFIKNFSGYDYIVCPSGSCSLHVKDHLHSDSNEKEAQQIRSKTYELVEFLHDVLKVDTLKTTFPYKVGLHASCHGLRGLKLGSSTERNIPPFNKTAELLSKVENIQLVDLDQPTECCGFGGTFAVLEEALSVKMGKDRIKDHVKHEAQVIAGNDMSCLMHMEGIINRDGLPIKVKHVAEILNGTTL